MSAPDGAELRVSFVAEHRDERARPQTTLLRYERHPGSAADAVERPWVLRWYPCDTFEALAATAGLTVTAVTDQHGAPAPHVHLRRPA
jgi:hypothetical protein